MDTFDVENEKQKKIHERVRSLIIQFSDKITKHVQLNTGRISDTRIQKIEAHSGAGGKTYVIQARISTALAGEVDGGIVLKFAKDLDTEVENANNLAKILSLRQKDWEQWKSNHELSKRIKKFPDEVFAPEVIHVIPEVKAMILEFLSGFTTLFHYSVSSEQKWGYAGYSLARLHGSKIQATNLKLYNPLFDLLRSTIDERFIDYWYQILEQSKGGVDLIHGDSHLSNILVSPMRIAWIDAIMLPKLDRMDDIGYILSHMAQENIAKNIGYGIDETKLINTITRSWVPLILTTYKSTYDISQLYSRLPLDFFLGSHLIIRAGLWEKNIADVLIKLGQRFIYEMPISNILLS